MLKLYGITTSRAFRPLWLLEELALQYEHIPLDYRKEDELQSESYRSINPNGHVPTLVDGDLVLWESMAINLYLANRYGADAGLWPDSFAGQGLCYQWSFWVMTEVEAALLAVLLHQRVLPEEQRNPEKARKNIGLLKKPLQVLDDALIARTWLADDHFTVADLNVAAVLAWAKPAKLDLEPWPNLRQWLGNCLDRPAVKKAGRRKGVTSTTKNQS